SPMCNFDPYFLYEHNTIAYKVNTNPNDFTPIDDRIFKVREVAGHILEKLAAIYKNMRHSTDFIFLFEPVAQILVTSQLAPEQDLNAQTHT
ncbi:hypothetical protein ACJX0J_032721, partial [Zea mays]